MPTLQDRLHDLAGEAPLRQHPGDLWDRGRRLHRRRRGGTLLIAATVTLAVAGLLGLAWQRTLPDRPVQPAEGAGALPDRLYEPSPWLPGTDDEGPLGVLAATLPAERGGWLGGGDGLVGVSAATGEYRFLDLPDVVHEAPTALAPDGRHLAYWVTGETDGAPNLEDPVVGVGVYDPVSGETRVHRIETEHGLAPYDGLHWAGADTLVFSYGQYRGGEGDSAMDRSSSSLGPVLVWDLAEPEPRVLDVEDGTDVVWAGPGRLLVGWGPYRVVDVADGSQLARLRFGVSTSAPVLSDDGRRVAVLGGSGLPTSVLLGEVRGDDRRVALRRVPSTDHTFEMLGWVDGQRLALRRRAAPGSMQGVVDLVDLGTGEAERVLAFPEGDLGTDQLATDLLDRPTFDAPEPPRPMDPRLVVGMSIVFVGVGLSAVGLWRRRVRA